MRTLVTGGAGFIGSHLAEALIDRRDEVYVVDDLSTGRLENLERLRNTSRLHFAQEGIADGTTLPDWIGRCDRVFHLAAAVGVQWIVKNPVRTIETNIGGTERVLRLAAAHGCKVLITSSSEVYGKSAKVPFSEEDDMVLGPTTKSRWAYACSKAVDEYLGLAYWKEKKLSVVIARLFNTVGPGQLGQYGMVIPRFIDQARAGGPIKVYGDGTQTRCFGHVKDVVHALVELMDDDRTGGQVFNVGSNEEISILELAKRVRAKVNPKAEIEFVPYDQAYESGFEDLKRRVPDLSKIKSWIGYSPALSLDTILDDAIQSAAS